MAGTDDEIYVRKVGAMKTEMVVCARCNQQFARGLPDDHSSPVPEASRAALMKLLQSSRVGFSGQLQACKEVSDRLRHRPGSEIDVRRTNGSRP